jgi:hypothetical protein
MAALKKTTETTSGSALQPKASSRRLEIATRESAPVQSAAQQLRLHLETALAASAYGPALPDPVIEKWPGAVRAAILSGAIILPWSLIALTVQAIVRYRLFPAVY